MLSLTIDAPYGTLFQARKSSLKSGQTNLRVTIHGRQQNQPYDAQHREQSPEVEDLWWVWAKPSRRRRPSARQAIKECAAFFAVAQLTLY